MTARIGYGAVSLTINSKTFFDTQDYLGDQRFRHSDALDRAFKAEGIVSLAGFPILSENNLQGVLFVADRYRRKLSEREISILGSFALHAGVAMRNAQAFTRLSEALAEAERNRIALIDHIHRVNVSAAAHDEMTSLLAKGTEWPLFIQRMADQIDGAIILHDEALAVRGRYSSASFRGPSAAALKDGTLSSSMLISAISQSRHSGRSVVLLDAGDERYRVMALHGGAERGESLVICHRGELDPIDIRNLERTTVALSIAKLWSEKRETEQLIASSTLLRHLILIDPPDGSTVSAIRDRLKIGAHQPVMLALIAISGLDRALQTTTVRAAAANMNLLFDLINDTYLAAGPEKSIRALLQTLLRRRKGWEIGGIVSDPFSDLTQAAVHYGRIEPALRMLRKMNRLDRFVEHSQVNLFAKLFEAGDASRIARYMGQILVADRRAGSAPEDAAQEDAAVLHRQPAQYRANCRASRRSRQYRAPAAEHIARNHRRLGRPDFGAGIARGTASRFDHPVSRSCAPSAETLSARDDPLGGTRQLDEFPVCAKHRRAGAPSRGPRSRSSGRRSFRATVPPRRDRPPAFPRLRHGESAGAGTEDDP